jgi:putative PEP-CTERM system TPR-repeat lipoprotein
MTRLAAFQVGWQYRIAQYQLTADNPDGAIFSLERALASQPDHLPSRVLLTEVEVRLARFEKAEQRARAISAEPGNESVGQRLLGDVALAQGRATDALAAYRAALSRGADTDLALRLYRSYFAAGQETAATEFMESWVRKNPQDALARRALAEGYVRTNRPAEARSAYEALLRTHGESADLLNNLAGVLARLGDPQALEYAQRAHALAPQDASIQDTLGWLLVQRGQLEAGLRHLREARLRAPGNPAIRYHLAAALTQVGRTDEARAELDAALKTTVAFVDREAARKLQEQLGTP